MNRTDKKVQRSNRSQRRITAVLRSGEFRVLVFFVAAALVYGKLCGRGGTPEWLNYAVVFLLLPFAAAIALYILWYLFGFFVFGITWLLNGISISLAWVVAKTGGKEK